MNCGVPSSSHVCTRGTDEGLRSSLSTSVTSTLHTLWRRVIHVDVEVKGLI